MIEQETECHFCHFCGADDVSAPFSKSVDGDYVCPECKRKYCIFTEDEVDELFPCVCGKKPEFDRKHLTIRCPNRCLTYVGYVNEDFNLLIQNWNSFVLKTARSEIGKLYNGYK